ncbi:type II secretion system protein GspG [bacterium]|nr:type II secretion system protein GspG [bacterium]
MKINPRHGKAAFTLIELMAVITIIVILAGLVVGGLGFVTERQAKEKAKVQIALLSKALEEYKLDMGSYPPTADAATGQGTSSLYQVLFYEGYEYNQNSSRADSTPPALPKATKIYLPDLDPTTSKQGWITPATTVPKTITTGILDPWGKEYRYRTAVNASGTANANTQNPDFDLWSYGKDGLSVPATPSNAGNKDDIRNF